MQRKHGNNDENDKKTRREGSKTGRESESRASPIGLSCWHPLFDSCFCFLRAQSLSYYVTYVLYNAIQSSIPNIPHVMTRETKLPKMPETQNQITRVQNLRYGFSAFSKRIPLYQLCMCLQLPLLILTSPPCISCLPASALSGSVPCLRPLPSAASFFYLRGVAMTG
jgi:hypothetical protein